MTAPAVAFDGVVIRDNTLEPCNNGDKRRHRPRDSETVLRHKRTEEYVTCPCSVQGTRVGSLFLRKVVTILSGYTVTWHRIRRAALRYNMKEQNSKLLNCVI